MPRLKGVAGLFGLVGGIAQNKSEFVRVETQPAVKLTVCKVRRRRGDVAQVCAKSALMLVAARFGALGKHHAPRVGKRERIIVLRYVIIGNMIAAKHGIRLVTEPFAGGGIVVFAVIAFGRKI